MTRLLTAMKTQDSLTANGAVTNSTSLNACVDMFFLAGASRNMSDKDIINLFVKAREADKNIAYKLLFWARDIRGGAGERRFFRVIWNYISTHHIYGAEAKALAKFVPEYGRYDDLFFNEILATLYIDHIKDNLEKKDGLLAKWLPRKGKVASIIRNNLKLDPGTYRRLIVSLSSTVEQLMSAKKWDVIKYSQVPSQAMNKYRKAFYRNDESRFTQFIDSVNKGESTIKAGTLFPHQLYQKRHESKDAIIAQWNALPDYIEGSDENIIPMCDVSGSMTGLPMDVSVSLGVYISERSKGIFRDHFITFTSEPTLQELKGDCIARFNQVKGPVGYNTNFVAAFELILNAAVKHKVPQKDMPTKILAISDMEFDQCGPFTNLDRIRQLYAQAGYKMPDLIFWNVNGRIGNVPAQIKDKNVGLVSGFSPSILTSILKGKIGGPEQLMLTTLSSDRYAPIVLD